MKRGSPEKSGASGRSNFVDHSRASALRRPEAEPAVEIEFTPFPVLQKTILGCLELADMELMKVWSAFELLTLSDLPFMEGDWAKAKQYGLYPDDSLDQILGLSIGYLCEVWPAKHIFDTIITVAMVERIRDTIGRPIAIDITGSCSTETVFSKDEHSILRGLFLSPGFVPPDTIENLAACGLTSWHDILPLSECDILQRFGLSGKAIRLMQSLLKLRIHSMPISQSLNTLARQANGAPSFESLMNSWTTERAKRNFAKVVRARLGWEGSEPKTLESVGLRFGLTRERIRQMEQKGLESLRHPVSQEWLEPFWVVVDFITQCRSGFVSLKELAQELQSLFRWPHPPSVNGLAALFEFWPKRFRTTCTFDEDRKIIRPTTFVCLGCPGAIDRFLTIVSSAQEVDANSLADELRNFCRNDCSITKSIPFKFNETSLDYLTCSDLTLAKAVKKIGGKYYHVDKWTLLHGRLLPAAEALLKSCGRAMHFREVFTNLRRLRPDLQSLEVRNVHAALARSNELLLWAPGTFIHEMNAPFPYDLIRQVEIWVAGRLKDDVPFVSISGAFKLFGSRCLAAGIITEQALYSCLKLSGDSLFSYPHHPYIYLAKKRSKRIPVPSALEEFIRRAGATVPVDEVRTYALDKLHLKDYQLAQSLERTPNIVRSEKGYLHSDYLGINQRLLDQLVTFICSLLAKQGHVSVAKVFQEKRIDCALMNIQDPRMLYSVLELSASDRIVAGNYPQLRFPATGAGLARGVAQEIIEFIKRAARVVAYHELEREFIETRGYSPNTLNWVLHSPAVFRYVQDCYVHKDTIGWSDAKQHDFEEAAIAAYDDAVRAGFCWGDLNLLSESEGLPGLGDDLSITPTLAADLLTKGSRFRIIGTLRRAFVPIPNCDRIEGFCDLLVIILKRHHHGAESLDVISAELHNWGIANKVTRSMLENSESVSIVNGEIMLTELASTNR